MHDRRGRHAPIQHGAHAEPAELEPALEELLLDLEDLRIEEHARRVGVREADHEVLAEVGQVHGGKIRGKRAILPQARFLGYNMRS